VQRVFKVQHSDEDVEKELNLIVDAGGVVEDVFIFHKFYGTVRAQMDIKSRYHVKQFLDNIATGKSSLLKNVTSGYHYHTVTADSEETLDLIEKSLQENGFLAPLQEYEPSGVN
jgi:transcriptional regulator of NAD metabolism